MNVEYYINKPEVFPVVQLSQADETEIIDLFASKNLTASRNTSGVWTISHMAMGSTQKNDGDWVSVHFVNMAGTPNYPAHQYQEVPAASVDYVVE
jgi:hypothetical protein